MPGSGAGLWAAVARGSTCVWLGWRDAAASWAAESCCHAAMGTVVLEQRHGSFVPTSGTRGDTGDHVFGQLRGASMDLWEAGLVLSTLF